MTPKMTQTTPLWISTNLRTTWVYLQCPPPLPLSPDAVAWLTHDELLVNQEFVKYINIVNMLLCPNASANCEFFFFSLFPHSLVDTHSLCTVPAFNFASSDYSASISHGAFRLLPYPRPMSPQLLRILPLPLILRLLLFLLFHIPPLVMPLTMALFVLVLMMSLVPPLPLAPPLLNRLNIYHLLHPHRSNHRRHQRARLQAPNPSTNMTQACHVMGRRLRMPRTQCPRVRKVFFFLFLLNCADFRVGQCPHVPPARPSWILSRVMRLPHRGMLHLVPTPLCATKERGMRRRWMTTLTLTAMTMPTTVTMPTAAMVPAASLVLSDAMRRCWRSRHWKPRCPSKSR
jgi:hypothetical protein